MALIKIVTAGFVVSATIALGQIQDCSTSRNLTHLPIRQLAVLPPRVQMTEDAVFDSRNLDATSEWVQRGFYGAIERAFDERGYKLWLDPFAMEEWLSTERNQKSVQAIEDKSDEILSKMGGGYETETLKHYSFTSDLEQLENSAKFDMLVMARGRGSIPTKGSKVLGAVTLQGTQNGELFIDLAVIDARSGKFFCTCHATAMGKFIESPSRISPALNECLQQFFLATKPVSP